MENVLNSSSSSSSSSLEYWLQWQVLLCALIFILPTAISLNLLLLNKRGGGDQLIKPADLWTPCFTNLNPRWLLFYRAFAFAAMAFVLYLTVSTLGFFSFFFYTQWTFALVVLYFALGTIVSTRGCWIQRHTKFVKEEIKYEAISSSNQKVGQGFVNSEQIGFLENLLHILYQTCAGAVMLTDIVFWCLLLPFMTGDDFQLTLLIGLMHSVNAIFLLLESSINRLSFTWFGLIYFVLWSFAYVVFQWLLHACCFTWWPYPFLDLSTPWAPLWYLGLALVHIPCYGLYMLLLKAKNAAFSIMFPHSFLRSS